MLKAEERENDVLLDAEAPKEEELKDLENLEDAKIYFIYIYIYMSIETDVPMNSLLVGQRYKFYFNRGGIPNPVYATVKGIITHRSILLTKIIDTVTNNPMPGNFDCPMRWINRVTINNIGPAGTGLNKYIGQYLGGRKRRSRKSRRTKKRRTRRFRRH